MTSIRASKPSERSRERSLGVGVVVACLACVGRLAMLGGLTYLIGVAGVAGLVACGAASPAVEAPASSSPPPRRPDAVVVEPPPALPAPVAHAEARGVVSLREPLGGDALRDVVVELA
ncbi:MAG TPA: hypothetical protein VIY73_17470, partial [Polyangiaceae bacterium]